MSEARRARAAAQLNHWSYLFIMIGLTLVGSARFGGTTLPPYNEFSSHSNGDGGYIYENCGQGWQYVGSRTDVDAGAQAGPRGCGPTREIFTTVDVAYTPTQLIAFRETFTVFGFRGEYTPHSSQWRQRPRRIGQASATETLRSDPTVLGDLPIPPHAFPGLTWSKWSWQGTIVLGGVSLIGVGLPAMSRVGRRHDETPDSTNEMTSGCASAGTIQNASTGVSGPIS